VLKEAQALGYAEADPSFDVDGFDTAHKLSILATIAFGVSFPRMDSKKIEGIRSITPMDIAFAKELGYRIKLLGVARLTKKGLMQRVAPAMVPVSSTLAHVNGVLNAVFIQGSSVGPLTLIGRGAGAGPTASAVLSDIVDCAVGRAAPAFGREVKDLKTLSALPDKESTGPFYLRLMAKDRPGVLADVAAVMRDSRISIQSLLQKGRAEKGPVPVVFITHECDEKSMAEALAALAKLQSVLEKPCVLRILPH
jgi:homoserine dehydrogenase